MENQIPPPYSNPQQSEAKITTPKTGINPSSDPLAVPMKWDGKPGSPNRQSEVLVPIHDDDNEKTEMSDGGREPHGRKILWSKVPETAVIMASVLGLSILCAIQARRESYFGVTIGMTALAILSRFTRDDGSPYMRFAFRSNETSAPKTGTHTPSVPLPAPMAWDEKRGNLNGQPGVLVPIHGDDDERNEKSGGGSTMRAVSVLTSQLLLAGMLILQR
ncbi:MAG: hypothetical protein Q9196_005664, partial [Gyalolechia fulgens]